MPSKSKITWVIGLILVVLLCVIIKDNYTSGLPVKDENKLFLQIRCLVCDGESLAESNADLAIDMRNMIREKINSGESEDEIKEFLVQRYGPSILQEPPFNPQTYLLWLTSPVLLLVGAILVLKNIRLRKKNGRSKLK